MLSPWRSRCALLKLPDCRTGRRRARSSFAGGDKKRGIRDEGKICKIAKTGVCRRDYRSTAAADVYGVAGSAAAVRGSAGDNAADHQYPAAAGPRCGFQYELGDESMLCPRKFNETTIDCLGRPMPGGRCECEKSKCAFWIPDKENMLNGECADVTAAKGLQALAGLAKMLGR